jgi:hypothetical protein
MGRDQQDDNSDEMTDFKIKEQLEDIENDCE